MEKKKTTLSLEGQGELSIWSSLEKSLNCDNLGGRGNGEDITQGLYLSFSYKALSFLNVERTNNKLK